MKRRSDSIGTIPGKKKRARGFRDALTATQSSQKKVNSTQVVTIRKVKGGRKAFHVQDIERSIGAQNPINFTHADQDIDTPVPQDTLDWVDEDGDEEGNKDEAGMKKRKSSKNSIKLAEWVKHHRETFLDEILRHEGPISAEKSQECSECDNHSATPVYRCLDCCDGMKLKCIGCLVQSHESLPFHRIDVWNGSYYMKTSLYDLGLHIQVGHDGSECSNPSEPSNLLVVHTSGIVTISVMYCGCKSLNKHIQLLRARWFPCTMKRIKTVFTFDVLENFQELNLQGKTTVYDYYHTLLRQSDFLKLNKVPSQLNNFSRVLRMWRHLQMLKRAGRGHDPSGPNGTAPGGLIVECPACPHPNKNLPSNWVDGGDRSFLYTLFVAIDANFKLKGKDRKLDDIELGSGWAAFVEEENYQTFISSYIEQSEINTCESEHDAVVRAAVRFTPGYSVTGAGLVICSRHCLIRPNGAGDLQKGERYCNMDYIVFSSIAGVSLPRIVLTYDIACQWSRKFRIRMKELPQQLQLLDSTDIQVAIPSWHINGHGKTCQDSFHVGYIPGVGRLCGDEVEQTWWSTNALGTSVREMSPANRHEILNDHWNSFNIRKIVGFRSRFAKNLKDAIIMRDKMIENHERFTATFFPELIKKWEVIVTTWEGDHSQPNPYVESGTKTTLQDVRLELSIGEHKNAQKGEKQTPKISMTSFLMIGLDLEDQQRGLKAEVRSISTRATARQQADLQQKQTNLLRRILVWRESQLAYTPCVNELLGRDPSASDDDGHSSDGIPYVSAEDIPLYLPSSLTPALRQTVNRIANMEAKLREAQASDAIAEICRVRRRIVGLTSFKKYNMAGEGNKANTRVRSHYTRYQAKITRAAEEYRAAWNALIQLDPHGEWRVRFQELRDSDIRGPGKEEDESHGHHLISWIWLVPQDTSTKSTRGTVTSEGLQNESAGNSESREAQVQIQAGLRPDWVKSRARVQRWEEEVELIKEEMRRVVAYLEWKASWWKDQAERRSNSDAPPDAPIKLGIRGYALKQAAYATALADSCAKFWLQKLAKLNVTISFGDRYIIPAKKIKLTTTKEGTKGIPNNSGTDDATSDSEYEIDFEHGGRFSRIDDLDAEIFDM